MADIPLKCRCGTVQGLATKVTATFGLRVVCCCDDCQAYARYLDQEEIVLDEYGGTDIFQMPVSQISITQGKERIRCVRLSPKGTFRWYAECCNTPLGNTLSAGIPFIGVFHNFMDDAGIRDKNLGPVLGYTQTKFAKKTLPPDLNQSAFPIRIAMRFFCKVILWKLKGLNKPSPFFDANGTPVIEPYVLNN